MASGRLALVAALSLFLLCGCGSPTAAPPPSRVPVPPPVKPVDAALAAFQNVDLCQIVEQPLPDDFGTLTSRPSSDNATVTDEGPSCLTGIDAGTRLQPVIEIDLDTAFSVGGTTSATRTDVGGVTLYLGDCTRAGESVTRTIYRPVTDTMAISVTFSIRGGSEVFPPTRDDEQQLCDHVSDAADALAPLLGSLPRYAKSVTAHDPCVPLVENDKTIKPTKVARSNGGIACDARAAKFDVRVVYGVPLAGRAPGDFPVTHHVAVDGTDVAEQEQPSTQGGQDGYCSLTWRAFPNSPAAEQGASVVINSGFIPGPDNAPCLVIQPFVAETMQSLKG